MYVLHIQTSQCGLATVQVLSFSELRGVRVSVHVGDREREREEMRMRMTARAL